MTHNHRPPANPGRFNDACRMTPRQRQTLSIIERYQAEHDGVSPTLQEIADALGLKSRGNVQDFINGLERQGYISRDPFSSRGITVSGSAGDLSGISDGALLLELARRGLLKVAEPSKPE